MKTLAEQLQKLNCFYIKKLNFFEFQKDLNGKRVIERNIEIIGEAVNRILKVKPDININNARKIVDTRNRISHGYDSVSDDIIWAIVVKDLSLLKTEINGLIAGFQQPDQSI